MAKLVEEMNADLVIDQKTNPARLPNVTRRILWDTQSRGLESRQGLEVTEIADSLASEMKDGLIDRMWTETEFTKRANRRLVILRHAEEVSLSVAATFGVNG